MDFKGNHYFLIGIKGTGMSNLAAVLKRGSAIVDGCDSPEVFPTDALLKAEGIEVKEGFGAEVFNNESSMVIFSDAYKPEKCPVLEYALSLSTIPVVSYTDFIGILSKQIPTYAVCGTNGKTTTVSATAFLLSRPSRKTFPFFALFGSTIMGQGPVFQGTDELLVEACEYQDHFLKYQVRGALVTSIEFDHPDYYADVDAVSLSFRKFVDNIGRGGFLICCIDSPKVKELSRYAAEHRRDLVLIEYGFTAKSVFRIRHQISGYSIDLLPYREFTLKAHAHEIITDYFGSALLATSILLNRKNPKLYFDGEELISDEVFSTMVGTMASDMQSFPGVKSRGEIFSIENGVVYVDDYAHHPSEIKVCLSDLRGKYPDMRLMVMFCALTHSRIDALLDDFVNALTLANVVVVQKTYPSAREEVAASDNGKVLAEKLESRALRSTRGYIESAVYIENDDDVVAFMAEALNQGEICLSLGGGNNRQMLEKVMAKRRS